MSADSGRLARWGPVVAWAAVIFVASTSWFTGAHTESFIVPVLAWLFPHAHRETLLAVHSAIRKLGHFTEYFVLGLLLARALANGGWQLRHAVMAVVLAALYATTDELHQIFVPGRTPAAGDVLIDTMGALASQIAFALGRRRAQVRYRPAIGT